MNNIKKLLKRYQLISIQVKASLWFVICSILQKGISLITLPLFTRMMSTEQYGYYSTYTSWYSIILVFTSFNFYYGVFNNAMIKFSDDKARYISSMQGLTTTLTTLIFLLYILLRDFFNEILGMNTLLVLLLFVQLMVSPALEFWLASNRFEYKYKKIVFVTLLKSVLNPILGIFLVYISTNKEIARIVSIVIVEGIFCGSIAIYQFLKGKCYFDKIYWKYAFFFNLPLLPHYLSGQILNQSDRIMIAKLVDSSAVAMYSLAYSTGLLANIFTSAINGTYTPWFYQRIKNEEYTNIGKITSLIVMFMASISVALMLFGPEIIYILAPAEYSTSVYIIPPVAGSVVFIFMYNIFANIEFYFEKRMFVLYGSVFAAIFNIALNYALIPVFGYVAAAYTTLFCYIIYCFMHAIFAINVCKKNKIPTSIYNIPSLLFISILIVFITIGINFLYHFTVIRYLLIILLTFICIMGRNRYIDIIKQLKKF